MLSPNSKFLHWWLANQAMYILQGGSRESLLSLWDHPRQSNINWSGPGQRLGYYRARAGGNSYGPFELPAQRDDGAGMGGVGLSGGEVGRQKEKEREFCDWI